MSNYEFIYSQERPQIEAIVGVRRRTLGESADVMLCEFTFVAGAIVPLHQHRHQQVGYIVSGEVEMTIGGEVRLLKAGDGYTIGSNVPHSARALVPSVALDAFSPPREDYRV
jgi:quercetin dioxygenase-like cupin family protein